MITKPVLKVVSNAANDNVVHVGPRMTFGRVLRIVGQRGGNALSGAFLAVRYVAFYPLMWLRIVVSFVCNLCAGLGLLALVLALLMKPEWALLWKLGAFSFTAFLISWFYDGLLLLLAPGPMMLDGRMTQ